jgi:hypothetical protein
VKYGIAHGLALVADDGSTFTADPLVLDTEMEIISSTDSDVGRIWAFDFGAAMDWSEWTFSLALQNAFANVSWKFEDFQVEVFDGHADLSGSALTDTAIAYSDLDPKGQQQLRDRLESSDPPKRLRLAALYRLGQKWTFSADYLELLGGTLREQWGRSLSVGAQANVLRRVPLRAGIATDFSQVGLAGGLGVRLGRVYIDASYSSLTLGAGDGAIISLSISIWPEAIRRRRLARPRGNAR